MAGIKNTKQAASLFAVLVIAARSKKPMFTFIPKIIGLLTATAAGMGKIPSEVKDMSPKEEAEVRAVIEKEAGKNRDLIPDKAEIAIINLLRAMG